MLTDEQEEQLKRERQAAKPERLLNDEDFEAIYQLDSAVMLQMPDEDRAKFLSTLNWHAEERMTMRSTDGIMIDGKSISEIAATNP